MKQSITTAIAALLLLVLIALGCSEGDTTGDDATSRTDEATPEQSLTEPTAEETPEEEEEVPEEVAEDEPEPEPEPTRAAPERIRFKRGATEGTIRFSLAPNESRRWVVGVSPAQYFHVGMDDERLDIGLPSTARLTEVSRGSSYVDGVTIQTGDIVFEIRNPTRNTIRTFAVVSIEDREPMDH